MSLSIDPHEETEHLINNLSYLLKYINKNKSLFDLAENEHAELIAFIQDKYRVKESELEEICGMLKGRKKEDPRVERAYHDFIDNLESYCKICGVRLYSKESEHPGGNGKHIDFDRLKNRISIKRSHLRREHGKLDEMDDN